MAAGEVDLKRYQIISLLYIIFVSLSVLNIKVSVLDSNIYIIRTFQRMQYEVLKKDQISKIVIKNNIQSLNNIKESKSYLDISYRLEKSLNKINFVLENINKELEKNKLEFLKEINSRQFIEKVLSSNKGVRIIESDLFELISYINKSQYKLPDYLVELVPLKKEILNLKGRKDDWQSYLFFHKPMGMSYLQLERIKLLIIQSKLLYEEAALSKIGYQPTYFSKFNPQLYVLKSNIKEYRPEEIINPGQKVIKISDEVFDDLFKQIIGSIHTDNIYAGVNVTLLNNINYKIGQDFDIEITPKVNVVNTTDKFIVVFNKTGEYIIKFYDLRENKKLFFEKKIIANQLPDPIVKIKGDKFANYLISVKELLNAERLEAILRINNLNYFPGRVNSYRVIKISNGFQEESIINYGELFQSPTQNLLGTLKKNDILIFENINMSLLDGSTRVASPIVYKISE